MELSDRAFALGVITAGAYWAAASAAAVLAAFVHGSGRPELSAAAPFRLLLEPTAPSLAFGPSVGSGWLYWSAFALVVVLAVLPILYVSLRRSNGGAHQAGCASSSEVAASAGRRALLRRARTLRPSLTSARPVDVGYRLGSSQGTDCHASIEDSIVVLGPPRSGKGFHLVVPMILDAPGAVLTTSTRPDNLTVTLRARHPPGPGRRLRPAGPGAGHRVSDAVVPDPRLRGPAHRHGPRQGADREHRQRDDGFDVLAGVSRAGGPLPAARGRAQRRASTADLYRWSLSSVQAREAVLVLATDPRAAPAWHRGARLDRQRRRRVSGTRSGRW